MFGRQQSDDESTRGPDDPMLIPVSRELIEEVDRARGEVPRWKYFEAVIDQATERELEADTPYAEEGADVDRERSPGASEEASVGDGDPEAGEGAMAAETADAGGASLVPDEWMEQVRTVFVLMWVAAIGVYGAGDTVSTYYVLGSGSGFEANPLMASLIDLHPYLLPIGKGVVLVALFSLSTYLFRKADRRRIPWGSVTIPGLLVVLGAFITTSNIYNIPSGRTRMLAAVSTVSAIAVIALGYLLLATVLDSFALAPGYEPVAGSEADGRADADRAGFPFDVLSVAGSRLSAARERLIGADDSGDREGGLIGEMLPSKDEDLPPVESEPDGDVELGPEFDRDGEPDPDGQPDTEGVDR